MTAKQDVEECLYSLRFHFAESEIKVERRWAPWVIWDEAIRLFFGIDPIDNGKPPLEYFKRHAIADLLHVERIQALHAWHEHHFKITPTDFDRFQRYTRLYDNVPPFMEEEPMSEKNWRDKEQEHESFDPRNPSRRRATTFSDGVSAAGIKHDDEWAIEREGRAPRDR